MRKFTFLSLIALLTLSYSGWGQVIISQYYEGSSNNKWIELTNVGTATVDLNDYYLARWSGTENPSGNGANYSQLTGMSIDAGEVLLFQHASAVLPTYASGTSTTACYFNGDDPVALCDGSYDWADRVDCIYSTGTWGSNKSFYRKSTVVTANTGISTLDGTGEWTEVTNAAVDGATATDTEYLGTHVYSTGGNPGPVITNITYSPGAPTSSDEVTVSADVTDDVSVANVECNWGTTDGGPYPNTIEMFIDAGSTYETDTDITAQTDGTTVYFVIEATDDESETSTSSQQSYTVTDPATTTLPYSQTFDSDLGDCYPFSVAGVNAWAWSSITKENSGHAYMNGWGGSNPEVDWLILPGIDLDSYSDEIMQFYTYQNYGNDDADNYLKLVYSSDYTGVGDPTGATWTELTYVQASSTDTWMPSGVVDLSGITGTAVYIAFKYYSTGAPRSWRVDDIDIVVGELIDVNFQVNMEEETVSGDGVHVAGSFQGWLPNTTELILNGTTGYHEVTVSLYAGIEYQFKYLNGNAWGTDEVVPANCQAPGTSNRFEVIGATDYSIDPVCFSSCTDCGVNLNYDITFQVDMQNETVSGDGVYLAGSFTNWGTNAILMTNSSGAVWETTVSLEETTSQEYKFVNGDPNSGGAWESISNRSLTVPSENTTLNLVCFNSYEACPPPELFISEVADPDGNINARFIELHNASGAAIDFDVVDWYLVKQVNGVNQYSFQLAGDVLAGDNFVVAGNSDGFNTAYGFTVYQSNSQISGNGDDGYYLYIYGDHTSGTLVDAYGVLGEDGTGKAWEYEDTKAVRLRSVTSPNATWTASEWDIPGAADVEDMTPIRHNEEVSWYGTSTSDWHTKGDNWSGTYGYIPDASFNVTVDLVTNAPVIASEASCNNLTMSNSSVLDANVGSALNVYGNLYMPSAKSPNALADFTIKGDATGNASVIIYGSAGDYLTVERYIPAHTPAGGWHNMASPVDMMDITGSDFEPGTNDDLYKWDEATNTWINYKGGNWGLDQFYATEGYLVAYETAATKSFYGLLTNWDWDFTNLSKTPTEGDGWHLLGNPFSSAVEWDATSWELSNIGGVAKVYNDPTGNYTDINNGDVIPSSNGFFVQAITAGNYIKIPASARIHSSQNNYKRSTTALFDETLVLSITNDENTYSDIARIGFKENATEDYDIQFDSHKLFGSSKAPQLWTVTEDGIYSQNYLPYVYESFQVPLNFRAGVNSTYHINADGLESFYDNSDIYLEDLFTEEVINLTEQQLYTFTAITDDAEDRFILHFYGVTSVDKPIAVEEAQIYAADHTVYIKFNKLTNDNAQVDVFNTIGQQVFSKTIAPQSLSSFNLNEKPGIYIVRLKTETGLTTQKVMIK